MECCYHFLHFVPDLCMLQSAKNGPEEVIVSDDPSNEEWEERHEEELGDKANEGTNWLLEHLHNNVFVSFIFVVFVISLSLLLYNTLTMIPMSSWAPMFIELSSTMITMTRVQNLFQNGLFMMMKTGVVILVSLLVATHKVMLLNPITSPLTQRGFVLPGPARSLNFGFWLYWTNIWSNLAVKVIEVLRSLIAQLSGFSNSALWVRFHNLWFCLEKEYF